MVTDEVNAVDVFGNCYGLEVLCNTFTSFGADIKLRSGSTVNNLGTFLDVTPGQNQFSTLYTFGGSQNYGIYLHPLVISPSTPAAIMGTYYHNAVIPTSSEIPTTNTGTITMNSNTITSGCDISCNDLLTVGFDEIENEGMVNIYPNPNSGSFLVEIRDIYHHASIEIYNNLGQKVKELNINNEKSYKIDIENLSNGIYVIIIQLDNEAPIVKKVIKRE